MTPMTKAQIEAMLADSECGPIEAMNRDAALIHGARDLARTAIALHDRVAELEAERRMIVSHATMGGTDGVGLGLNDIAVRITALRNRLWDDARATLERTTP